MIALYAFASLYVLWIFYVAVMAMRRAKENGTLSKPALALGIPVLIVGYALDVAIAIVLMPFLFLDRWRSWTVTGTLKYHLYNSSGWRETMAAWFCVNLLNVFDPDGRHC